MGMRKTSVAIDEDLLRATREVLETTTIRDTIEQAFLEVLRGRARHEEVQRLTKMQGMDLADEEVMAGAWR